MSARLDERCLQKRRKCWYAVQEIPRSLRPAFNGKRRLIRSLHTPDLHLAVARRHAVLADFQRQFESARVRRTHDPIMQSALEWRDAIDRLERGDLSQFHTTRPADPGMTPQENALAVAYAVVDDEADRIEHGGRILPFDDDVPGKPGDPAAAQAFRNIATGRATPLEPFIDSWLAEQDIEARSKGDHRRAVKELLAWIASERLAQTIEVFDRRTAGRYVTHLLSAGLDRQKTVTKRLWSLSRLWAWLESKGYTEGNPWRGHDVGRTGRSARDKQQERPFTPDELRALLAGNARQPLRDMMRLALLSGARIEELSLLRVKDIDTADGTMSLLADPKTPSSRRIVPIHSAVRNAVDARMKGREANAFLFPELGPAPKEGRQRSMALSKAFGRYRVRVGVDDKAPGQRRGLVNFHSFRRTFVTLAEHAGQPESIIRSVVGHKRPGMTLGVYSAGPSLAQRRACVEAVRLPVP
jgi:integrase